MGNEPSKEPTTVGTTQDIFRNGEDAEALETAVARGVARSLSRPDGGGSHSNDEESTHDAVAALLMGHSIAPLHKTGAPPPAQGTAEGEGTAETEQSEEDALNAFPSIKPSPLPKSQSWGFMSIEDEPPEHSGTLEERNSVLHPELVPIEDDGCVDVADPKIEATVEEHKAKRRSWKRTLSSSTLMSLAEEHAHEDHHEANDVNQSSSSTLLSVDEGPAYENHHEAGDVNQSEEQLTSLTMPGEDEGHCHEKHHKADDGGQREVKAEHDDDDDDSVTEEDLAAILHTNAKIEEGRSQPQTSADKVKNGSETVKEASSEETHSTHGSQFILRGVASRQTISAMARRSSMPEALDNAGAETEERRSSAPGNVMSHVPKTKFEDVLDEAQHYLAMSMLVYIYSQLREMSVLGYTEIPFRAIDVNAYRPFVLPSEEEMEKRTRLSLSGSSESGETADPPPPPPPPPYKESRRQLRRKPSLSLFPPPFNAPTPQISPNTSSRSLCTADRPMTDPDAESLASSAAEEPPRFTFNTMSAAKIIRIVLAELENEKKNFGKGDQELLGFARQHDISIMKEFRKWVDDSRVDQLDAGAAATIEEIRSKVARARWKRAFMAVKLSIRLSKSHSATKLQREAHKSKAKVDNSDTFAKVMLRRSLTRRKLSLEKARKPKEEEKVDKSDSDELAKMLRKSLAERRSSLEKARQLKGKSKVDNYDTDELAKKLKRSFTPRRSSVKMAPKWSERAKVDNSDTQDVSKKSRRSLAQRRSSLENTMTAKKWFELQKRLGENQFSGDVGTKDLISGTRHQSRPSYFRKGSVLSRMVELGEVVWFGDRHPNEAIYCICCCRTTKTVTVIFRGSVNAHNWLYNMKFMMSDHPNPLADEEYDGRADRFCLHTGFGLYMLRRRRDDGRRKIDEILNKIDAIGREIASDGKYRFSVTGHSLGGALATICSFYAATDERFTRVAPVRVFTFAAPRVGDERFRDAYEHLERSGKLLHARIVAACDVVPLTPFVSLDGIKVGPLYKHVGLQIRLHAADIYGKARLRLALETQYTGRKGFWPAVFRAVINSVLFNLAPPKEFKKNHRLTEHQRRIHFARQLRLGLGKSEFFTDNRRRALKTLEHYYAIRANIPPSRDYDQKRSSLKPLECMLVILFLLVSVLATMVFSWWLVSPTSSAENPFCFDVGNSDVQYTEKVPRTGLHPLFTTEVDRIGQKSEKKDIAPMRSAGTHSDSGTLGDNELSTTMAERKGDKSAVERRETSAAKQKNSLAESEPGGEALKSPSEVDVRVDRDGEVFDNDGRPCTDNSLRTNQPGHVRECDVLTVGINDGSHFAFSGQSKGMEILRLAIARKSGRAFNVLRHGVRGSDIWREHLVNKVLGRTLASRLSVRAAEREVELWEARCFAIKAAAVVARQETLTLLKEAIMKVNSA